MFAFYEWPPAKLTLVFTTLHYTVYISTLRMSINYILSAIYPGVFNKYTKFPEMKSFYCPRWTVFRQEDLNFYITWDAFWLWQTQLVCPIYVGNQWQITYFWMENVLPPILFDKALEMFSQGVQQYIPS